METLEVSGSTLPLAIILDTPNQVLDSRLSRSRPVVTTESASGIHSAGTWLFPAREPRYTVPRGYTSKWITVPGGER